MQALSVNTGSLSVAPDSRSRPNSLEGVFLFLTYSLHSFCMWRPLKYASIGWNSTTMWNLKTLYQVFAIWLFRSYIFYLQYNDSGERCLNIMVFNLYHFMVHLCMHHMYFCQLFCICWCSQYMSAFTLEMFKNMFGGFQPLWFLCSPKVHFFHALVTHIQACIHM